MDEKEDDVTRIKKIQTDLHANFIEIVKNSRGEKLIDPEK